MNTEYIDSLDEAAYISSLEQRNRELLAVLTVVLPVLEQYDKYLTCYGKSAPVRMVRDAIAKATA